MNSDSTLALIAESPSTVAGAALPSRVISLISAARSEIPLETVLSIDPTKHPEAYWGVVPRWCTGPRRTQRRTQAPWPGLCGSPRAIKHAEHRRPAPAGRALWATGNGFVQVRGIVAVLQ